jgi:DNA invertase Pin-like site-specific DNA recombinase
MNIGYTRVSTLDLNLDLQVQALRKAACKKNLPREGLRRPALLQVVEQQLCFP